MNLIGIIFLLVSATVSSMFKRRFNTYAKTKLRSNWSGAEIADKMLRECGVDQVKITCTRGHLTDHYNPLTKTVNVNIIITNTVHFRKTHSQFPSPDNIYPRECTIDGVHLQTPFGNK